MLSRKACHLIATARDDNLLLFPHGRLQGQEGQKPVSGQCLSVWAVPQPGQRALIILPSLGLRKAPREAQSGERQGRQPTPGLCKLETLLSAELCTGSAGNPDRPPSAGCQSAL